MTNWGGTILNIGSGVQTSILEIKDLLESKLGKTLNLEKRGPRPLDIEHSRADIKRAKNKIKYNPSTSIDEGLELTIEWFNKRK